MKKRLKINIANDAVFFVAILIVFTNVDLILPLVIASCVHEAGHIIAILTLGGEVTAITVNVGGLKISYSTKVLSYKYDLIYAAAGPLFGIIFSYVASRFGFTVFAGISLCINAFNLIPVRPLDGGKILFNVLSLVLPYDSKAVVVSIEIICIAALYCGSIYFFMVTKSCALVLISCVLTFYYCKER